MKLNFTFAVVLGVVLYEVKASLFGRGKSNDTRNTLELLDSEINSTKWEHAEGSKQAHPVIRKLSKRYLLNAQQCWNVGKAAEYDGPVSTTIFGKTCIAWDTHDLDSDVDPNQFPERNKGSAQNFCRDPTGQGMPWCYVNPGTCRTDFLSRRICNFPQQYCIAPLCSGHKQFCIKHKFSGKILDDSLDIESNPDREECDFIFVKTRGIWGYIQNVYTGYYVVPNSESLTPADGEELWLRDMTPHAENEFAFDQVRNVWVHRSGKYVTQEEDTHLPSDGCDLELRDGFRVDAQWELVDPSNLTAPMLIYDEPKITGRWIKIYSVLDPKAEHEETYKVSIGQTVTTSTTFQGEFTLQLTVSGAISKYNASMSATMRIMYEQVGSETWKKNTTRTRTIRVKPGQSVVVWQYVFEVDQEDQKNVFQSNILADTDSVFKVPRYTNITSDHLYTI